MNKIKNKEEIRTNNRTEKKINNRTKNKTMKKIRKILLIILNNIQQNIYIE